MSFQGHKAGPGPGLDDEVTSFEQLSCVPSPKPQGTFLWFPPDTHGILRVKIFEIIQDL